MTRTLRAFTALVLFSACAGSLRPSRSIETKARIEVCVDSAFDAHYKYAVREACGLWTDATLGGITLLAVDVDEILDPPPFCDMLVYRAMSDFGYAKLDDRMVGFVDCIGCTRAWIVVDRMPHGMEVAVIAHELGHLLGATHDVGLMAPINPTRHVAPRALIEVSLHAGGR